MVQGHLRLSETHPPKIIADHCTYALGRLLETFQEGLEDDAGSGLVGKEDGSETASEEESTVITRASSGEFRLGCVFNELLECAVIESAVRSIEDHLDAVTRGNACHFLRLATDGSTFQTCRAALTSSLAIPGRKSGSFEVRRSHLSAASYTFTTCTPRRYPVTDMRYAVISI
eukprot:313772-Rhodomonas_salina.2